MTAELCVFQEDHKIKRDVLSYTVFKKFSGKETSVKTQNIQIFWYFLKASHPVTYGLFYLAKWPYLTHSTWGFISLKTRVIGDADLRFELVVCMIDSRGSPWLSSHGGDALGYLMGCQNALLWCKIDRRCCLWPGLGLGLLQTLLHQCFCEYRSAELHVLMSGNTPAWVWCFTRMNCKVQSPWRDGGHPNGFQDEEDVTGLSSEGQKTFLKVKIKECL